MVLIMISIKSLPIKLVLKNHLNFVKFFFETDKHYEC